MVPLEGLGSCTGAMSCPSAFQEGPPEERKLREGRGSIIPTIMMVNGRMSPRAVPRASRAFPCLSLLTTQ